MLLFSQTPSDEPPPRDACEVVLWNLRHGGGNTRTPEQALFLLQHDPDIVVLNEVRASRGSQLLAALAAHGLPHAVMAPAAEDRTNRVAIIARDPITIVQAKVARLIIARTTGLTIIAAHVPDESAPRPRAELWQRVVDAARTHRDEHTLIAADFNTSRTGVDPLRRGQTCERHMGTLASLGYADVWRIEKKSASDAWSWAGPRGERHRLDAIFASQTLQKHAENAVYDTTCAEQGLSDHALLRVRLRARNMWKTIENAPVPAENHL